MKWPILFIAFLASFWVLPGCPQASQSGGGMAPVPNDFSGADVTPPSPVAEGAANAEPIDPKTDPRGIGNGTSGTEGTGEEERIHVNGDSLGFGRIEERPLTDARLHYGPDSKLLAKSPAAPYTIHAKSDTLSLSFTMDLTGDPVPVDSSWFLLTSDMSPRPQLRAVYVPPGPHPHILYSDAEWTADTGGTVTYAFANLTVAEGGELRFFVKETNTADLHSGALAALDSDDASKPFPSEPTAVFFPAGSFVVKAVIISPTQGPSIWQRIGPAQPIFKP
ncbi:MAG TPA: hypothetical protein VFX30_09170 [bacterium]|nr:hypothetical protein [bacterium]